VTVGERPPPDEVVLGRFMPAGRIDQMPARRSRRLVVLDHVSRTFEPGRRYAEAEVDVVLRAYFDDYVALRRYLVDEGFLAREGGLYWRSGGRVEV
jgi:hypothetical protein